jgi:hypothetical protein
VGQSITTAGCGQTKRVIEQKASSTKTTCVRQPRTCVLIESGMAPTDKTVGAISAKMARHHRGDGGAPSGNTQEAAGTRRLTKLLDFRKLAELRCRATIWMRRAATIRV